MPFTNAFFYYSIRRVGMKIIQDKKEILRQEIKDNSSSAGRDLLTLLIKSNIDVETTGDNKDQTISDDEVLGRTCPNFHKYLHTHVPQT